MKKRKYVVMNYRYDPEFIISFIDKKYKLYDFNDNGNYVFYPKGVKIEKESKNSAYFIRFGRLYKRCAINEVNSTHYYHKKYNRRIYCLCENCYGAGKYFDDLDSAKLWLELQEKDRIKAPDDCECCEAAG